MLLIQIQKIEVGKPFEKLGELHIKSINKISEDKREYLINYWDIDNEEFSGRVIHSRNDGFLSLIRKTLSLMGF